MILGVDDDGSVAGITRDRLEEWVMTALFGKEGFVENGLVEQAVEFTRRNTQVSAALVDGARREQRWSYPEVAIREAIVNALVHRDYLLCRNTTELHPI